MGILEYHNKRQRQKTCSKAFGMTRELSQFVIQRIQSFLSEREAVCSSLLSKEWLRAWSTFPVLQFDQSRFVMGRNLDAPNTEGTIAKFVSFVDRTLFRFRMHNLLIEELHLSISIVDGVLISRLNSWFERASELNLSKYFVKIEPANFSCTLSLKAFATDTLESLSISGCRLDKLQITNCNLLVSLNLTKVYIDDQVLQILFSSCPFIETFTLIRPRGLRKLHVTRLLHLKSLTIEVRSNVTVEIDTPSIQSVHYEVSDFPSSGHLSINSRQNLTYVSLCGAIINDMFAEEFPALKYLDLNFCTTWYSDVHIRSDSLHTLNVFDLENNDMEIKIDAPNLESLTYCGDRVPKFESRNNSQSRLKGTLDFPDSADTNRKWFMELNEALKELHQSEVCLSLETTQFHISLEELRAVSCPSLEHVDFYHGELLSPLGTLEALFSVCRPKYISLSRLLKEQAKRSAKFLTKTLLKDRTNLSCSCLDFNCWRRCLKGAEMVLFDQLPWYTSSYRYMRLEW